MEINTPVARIVGPRTYTQHFGVFILSAKSQLSKWAITIHSITRRPNRNESNYPW